MQICLFGDPNNLFLTGCDLEVCFDDTWAIDVTSDDPVWMELTDLSSGGSGGLPEARFTVAGGVYPGSDWLWLSMGETISGRRLSDTWTLQLNLTDDSISG